MTLKLKPLELSDSNEKELFLQILKENYTKVPYPASEDIFQRGKHFFFAFDNNKRIGVTGYHLKTPTLAETIKTVILPEHQGKGYGQRLSQLIEDHCRDVGIKKVMSTIYADNTKMISIKLSQGYTIEGYHPDHEAPGWHEYSLGKILG